MTGEAERATDRIRWEESDPDEPGRLWARDAGLTIAGAAQHVFAIAVADRDGLQCAANPFWQPDLDRLQTAAAGRLATVELAGYSGSWVVYAEPFGD